MSVQRGATFTYTGTFFVETCCDCGVPFGLDTAHKDHLQRTGSSFWCPNGHPQHYTNTTKVKMQRLEREAQEARDNARFWQERSDANARRAAAARGVTTRLKNRIRNGVCPFCNRHFENVQRHMDRQHAEHARRKESTDAE